MTEQQIRDTVAHMNATEQARGIRFDAAKLKRREKLARLAIAGEQGARFVVYTHFKRQQAGKE